VTHIARMAVPLSYLSEQPAWDLDTFRRILDGDTDVDICQISDISDALEERFSYLRCY
jgi:hypothetical protein